MIYEVNSDHIKKWLASILLQDISCKYLESYIYSVFLVDNDVELFKERKILVTTEDDMIIIGSDFKKQLENIGINCELGAGGGKRFLLFDSPDAITMLKLMV